MIETGTKLHLNDVFTVSLVPEPFKIIRIAGPIVVTASGRSPMVPEYPRSPRGARYQPSTSASEVSYGNGPEFQSLDRSGKFQLQLAIKAHHSHPLHPDCPVNHLRLATSHS
ncbi:nucleoside diphosphate-linked moiety X motif 19 isoform X5 [Amblyraja radiata]|uniref:nucleoside diphosphate-linked moiety X motif 19 isoform X5 n=1 Tax=Amblyraja radiata TaxID=386614 RepID=UPI0014032A04|nr:nucleoside diphosphate-linked moiety X motif 19 isoform X5 [Amblyraja radiata]